MPDRGEAIFQFIELGTRAPEPFAGKWIALAVIEDVPRVGIGDNRAMAATDAMHNAFPEKRMQMSAQAAMAMSKLAKGLPLKEDKIDG